MKKFVWLERAALLFLYQQSLARFGGEEGIRDEGLLESALARPRNAAGHNPDTEVTSLAAAYAFGITKNHPFVDGNKRTGFLAAALFLERNGWRLEATQTDAYSAMMALASGEIDEAKYATWLKARVKKI